jgi:hypothetical protein
MLQIKSSNVLPTHDVPKQYTKVSFEIWKGNTDTGIKLASGLATTLCRHTGITWATETTTPFVIKARPMVQLWTTAPHSAL